MRLMQEMDLTIEEMDALTGQAVGWPKSATFRTIDLVGLDILGHVVGNMDQRTSTTSAATCSLPDFFKQMLERKWLGDKTKGGFYKKGEAALRRIWQEDERLALDWKTLEYHPRQKPKFAALDMAKNVEDTGARLRMLLGLDGGGPQKSDKAGRVPVGGAIGSVDLLRQPRSRNFRLDRRDRSRDASGLQLGTWAVRTLGCCRRGSHGRAHEERRPAGGGERGTDCWPRARKRGTWTIPSLPAGRKYWESGDRELGAGAGPGRRVVGRQWRRKRMAW